MNAGSGSVTRHTPFTWNRIATLLGTGLLAIAGIVGLGAAGSASAAPQTNVCNAYAATGAGQGMECTVTVENYVNGADDYSIVTVLECHGAAYTVLLPTQCTTTVFQNMDLTTEVNQCNGSLNGGGSNVTCSVRVTNNFSGVGTPATVTLNQCIGSGTGGTSPSGPPLNCAPPGSTTSATVTQCNGSVNGGGSPLRVNCTLPLLSASALPVTVNQCNGTVNGGGSVLFCFAEYLNNDNVTVFPPSPTADSSALVTPNVTGGTFGTAGGPNFAPAVVVAAAAAAGAAAAALAVSGMDSVPLAIIGSLLILLGAAAFLFGRRNIHRPAHRMG